MAAQMLEKILEAENAASLKLKDAEKTAQKIVADSENEAVKLLTDAKEKARNEALLYAQKNAEYSDSLVKAKIEEAEKASLLMSEKAKERMQDCIKTIVEMITV